MTLNSLPARTVLILCAVLLCAVAQTDEPRGETLPETSQPTYGVPTTIATLPHDSEGLTVDPDTETLYTAEAPDASGDCFVRSITLSGIVSIVGLVPKPSGGPCSPRGLEFRAGRIYISDQATGADGWVFEMNPATGQATTFASGVPGANGIAFDSHGNLWITDSQRGFGRVYKRDAATGTTQEAFRVPPVANGTTYGGLLSVPTALGVGRQILNLPQGTQLEVRQVANGVAVVGGAGAAMLYMADTARGAIWAVRLDQRGNLVPGQTGCNPTLQNNTLCEDSVFVAHPRLEGADGIWADWDGSLWVAAAARQGIVRVDRRGTVTEIFRNPVNSQLLRSSSGTAEGNTHIFEFPTNPVIVPTAGSRYARTLCVTSSDRGGRDNNPATAGEIGGPGQDKGKVSCFF